MENQLEKRIISFIKQYHMIEPKTAVIAAVSGGADSVCLLKILNDLKEDMDFYLTAVHVHHGLRGEEADRDSRFTGELCQNLGIFCRTEYVNVREYAAFHKLSEEEAGRILRYQVLEEEADRLQAERGFPAVIAAAHHRDDDTETILHNLFRGSGLRGLAGIRPVRERLIRPLLCVTRQEILEYLKEQEQEYCVDSTNESEEYTRNRLRNHIIPDICREINEDAPKHIAGAGKLLMEADAYFENLAKEWLLERQGKLLAADILKEAPIVRSYIVRQAIEKTGAKKDISLVHVEGIMELFENQVGKEISLPGGKKAVRTYDSVEIKSVSERETEGSLAFVSDSCLDVSVFSYEKGMEIPKNQYTKWFDYDRIKGALSVRTRQTGDYLLLKSGGKKSVKSYMIDAKIPAAQRGEILLLAEDSHILWIIGYRASDGCLVTSETKTILQVKVKTNGGENHGG